MAYFYAGQWIDKLCRNVPEFDGPASIAAVALLVSVAAVVYDKAKK